MNQLPIFTSSVEGKPFTNVYYSKITETTVTTHPVPTAAERQQQSQVKEKQHFFYLSLNLFFFLQPIEKCMIIQNAKRPPSFYLQLQEEKHEFNPGEISQWDDF